MPPLDQGDIPEGDPFFSHLTNNSPRPPGPAGDYGAEQAKRFLARGGRLEDSVYHADGKKHKERVYLRVYDLGQTVLTRGVLNRVTQSYGAFHTGVEVYGREWSFGMTMDDVSTGITWNAPGQNTDHSFRETLSMGYTTLSQMQVQQLIKDMKWAWRGCTYNLLTRNCHHFSDTFCQRLGVMGVPAWVNTLATSGAGVAEWVDSADSGYDGGEALTEFFGSLWSSTWGVCTACIGDRYSTARGGQGHARKSLGGQPLAGPQDRRTREPVALLLYEDQSQAGKTKGGVRLSTVEVYGEEWAFLPTGIARNPPMPDASPYTVKTMAMGYTSLTRSEVVDQIQRLQGEWLAPRYHPTNMNCHHFSDELCCILGVSRVPVWVNQPQASRPSNYGADGSPDGSSPVKSFFGPPVRELAPSHSQPKLREDGSFARGVYNSSGVSGNYTGVARHDSLTSDGDFAGVPTGQFGFPGPAPGSRALSEKDGAAPRAMTRDGEQVDTPRPHEPFNVLRNL